MFYWSFRQHSSVMPFFYMRILDSVSLATSCEELTHWKRLWCWEGLGAGGEGDDRGWDGWMASLTQWTWVWVNSGSWWWTGRPGVLWFMGSQSRTRLSDWTELNWTEHCSMSGSNCCFLTCIQISQEAGQVVWYSYLFQNFPQFVVIRTVKGFGIINKAEVDVFLQLSCFFDDPVDVGNLSMVLAVWSLVLLPFLNPSWTFASSRFMYCWTLTWRI